eukprot:1106814-Prymnesium_polylepis.1
MRAEDRSCAPPHRRRRRPRPHDHPLRLHCPLRPRRRQRQQRPLSRQRLSAKKSRTHPPMNAAARASGSMRALLASPS